MSVTGRGHAGRRYLITGASSGLGAAVARHLAGEGAHILAVARDASRLAEVLARCAGTGHESVAADLTDGGSRAELIETVRSGGPVNGVVHAAGVFRPAPLPVASADDFTVMWRTNVEAPYLLTRDILASLVDDPAIVFISSVSGHKSMARQSGYAATKGAVEAMMRSLAVELAPRGVRVNSVAPGFIATEMNAAFRADESVVQKLTDAVAVGHLGSPDDIARAVAFLLDPGNGFVIGHRLEVDGGYPTSAVARGVLA